MDESKKLASRIKHHSAALIIGTLVLFQVGSVQGQTSIAPIQDQVAGPAGWSGLLDGTFALSQGNTNLLDAGFKGHLQFQTFFPIEDTQTEARSDVEGETDEPPPEDDADQEAREQTHEEPPVLRFIRDRVFLTVQARYYIKIGETVYNKAFTHLRWTHFWVHWFGTELFTQTQFNELIKLNLRVLGGGGFRFNAVTNRRAILAVGTGYMVEYQVLDVPDDGPEDPRTLSHRWTSYLTARVNVFDGRLKLSNTLYVQPRFDDLSDLRLLENFDIEFAVTDVFAVVVGFGIQFDSRPPQGVERTDIRLRNSFGFRF